MAGEPNILIVDDTESARDTLAALLYPEGCDLRFAENGPRALEMMREAPPDLILLDVMMPGMNGHEVCRAVRADPRTAEIPVVMITALDDGESRLRGIEAGADNFIAKPFNRGELRAQVRTLLRLNRYRRLVYERSRFEWVVEQADDGFLALSADRKVQYANPRARRFLFPAEAEARGAFPDTPFPELALGEFQLRPESLWGNWPEPAEAPRFLLRPDSLAANALWLQTDLMPGAGRPEEPFLVRLRDVTAQVDSRKMTWSLHRQISHKLKTPLNGLTGALDLLHADGESMDASERTEFTAMAAESARRLQNGILDIFQYIQSTSAGLGGTGRCPAGKIAELAAEVAEELGVEPLELEIRSGLETAAIFLSPTLLRDLFFELMENALKFHPRNRPSAAVRVDAVGERLRIRVSDDGAHLSPVQLRRIWHPYYQGDKDATGEVPGMGLGLSMVAVVVGEAGGACRAYNRPDREGLVVELEIPAAIETGEA
jgi:CheY-like chemotaxis protein